jgi:quinol-cytochrome oxidoreductase complex cytochrome b subunit
MPSLDETTGHLNITKRIWYSIFPGTYQKSVSSQSYRNLFNSLVLHFRPRAVPERTLALNLTWGLGGMAVVLVTMLFVTGLMMKFVYQPMPGKAYDSIVHLQNSVLFGQLIRNLHHWSGNGLLLVVLLHLLRVFFSGAFHKPRQFNWIIGLLIFILVLGSNISGYLLPWDQLAYWAITICTGMLEYIPGIGSALQNVVRGGSEIGPATLSNFYAIHTAMIPAGLILLMPFHFWRVRKAGGLVVPRSSLEDVADRVATVPAIPNLIIRELVVALVLIAFMMVLAVTFDAPLAAKANPGLSPNPTKAPWYFAGIQELLLHFHPLFAVLIIPAIAFAALVSLPYLKYDADTSGIWFCSRRGRRMAIVAAIGTAILTPLGIVADEYFINFAVWFPAVPTITSGGLLPAFLALIFISAFYWVMKKGHKATNNEAIQSVFILLLVAFIILTATCVWFRGSGMALVWPWDG